MEEWEKRYGRIKVPVCLSVFFCLFIHDLNDRRSAEFPLPPLCLFEICNSLSSSFSLSLFLSLSISLSLFPLPCNFGLKL